MTKERIVRGGAGGGPRVIVVGAGPAGLFAALSAARSGARVTVLERQARPGRKLLASGGGRGNITNTLSPEDFIARFGRGGRFIADALKALPARRLVELLAAWGVPCRAADGMHVFPESGRAGDILAALTRQLASLNVQFSQNSGVSRIAADGANLAATVSDGTVLRAESVVLAAGGAAYPGLGGGGSGYELAAGLGHAIITPVPALVGLRTRETWPGACAGVTMPNAEARIVQRGSRHMPRQGALLFTHRGLSGPAILDLSGDVCRLLLKQESVRVRVRFADWPNGAEAWQERMSAWRQDRGGRTAHNAVSTLAPHRLAATLCELCAVGPAVRTAKLPRDVQQRLISLLDGPVLEVTGSGGFEEAMVTNGGVSLRDVRPETLASNKTPGLFFAGEILDVDGPCGGFNLQWAASSGWLAGASAGRLPRGR